MRVGQITEVKRLAIGVVETNAFGGCYIDRKDFAAREQVEPGMWRMYDHEDEAIPASGPLYQYADDAMVTQMEDLLA